MIFKVQGEVLYFQKNLNVPPLYYNAKLSQIGVKIKKTTYIVKNDHLLDVLIKS